MACENLFSNNIGSKIIVKIISSMNEFEGILLDIQCNTFIIENKHGLMEMFRFEDILWMKCEPLCTKSENLIINQWKKK